MSSERTGDAQPDFLRSFGVHPGRAETHVHFMLVDTFAFMPFISVLEVLRLSNRLSGRQLFSWDFLSTHGNPALANNGLSVPVIGGQLDGGTAQIAVVCGPHDPFNYRDRNTYAWVRKFAGAGCTLMAVDTGTYLLARAGVLQGYRCTLHWENIPGFVEEFPDIVVSQELFERDHDRVTCAGGTAAMDMMLAFVQDLHGKELAAEVSEMLIHSAIRLGREPQRMNLRLRTGVSHPALLESIELMEANVEQPLSATELSDAVGISRRQLERLFRRYMETTPSRYYLNLRLHRSMQLLQQTSLPIIEIALACGFATAGHFSQSFRALFDQTPREARRQVRTLW
ncbi:MAG: GlxA family transcriptional regulator [Pseudomonadota bacterium]